MLRKVLIIVIFICLILQIFGFLHEAEAQAESRLKNTEPFWSQVWKSLREHTFLFSIILVTLITIFSTVMAMLKKDKLLKSLTGHLVTIELKDGNRYRGRLRVEAEGLEVVEEKANQSNEKISYLLRKDEMDKIHALVRYLDFLTDKEKEERAAEVNKVYHPSIGMRFRRKMRNVINEFRRVATEAFKIVFGKVREQLTIDSRQYGKEIETAGTEAVSYATEATYDALIDRLIGTKVVARVSADVEYIGVLKDYTSQFIALLDVSYKNNWVINMDRGHSSRHERGVILRKDGSDIVIQSKSPFPVMLMHIYWTGEMPADAKREKIKNVIEPFSELRFNLMPPTLDITVGPFEKLKLPTNYHYQRYKNIAFHFESIRTADIVMLKNYGIVRHRTEKFEPKFLDFGALADAMLTNKGEELVLKGNTSDTQLTIYNGYLTNLPRERMETQEVDIQVSQRWTMDNFFASLDKKLRPTANHHAMLFLPLRKPRSILSMFALLQVIHANEKRKRDPLLPFIYLNLINASRKKRHKVNNNHVLIKKKRKGLLKFLTKFSQT